jgi:glyoxylase-like metal-dependent hydrolase (beta-lactamase superfamily II)
MSPTSYSRGLREVGDGLYAYFQPDGSWGWSNAGLIVDGEASLLVDTLFDLKLTEDMLASMRDAVPAARQIGTVVNTHANGDHTFGNQLVGGAQIIASEKTAQEMGEAPPELLAGMVEQAPNLGQLGAYVARIFGPFEFRGITLTPPSQTFSGEHVLRVGGKEVRLIEAGPAHTQGDTMVHVPADGVLYTGDILFHGGHPVAWAGPLSNWVAACERILDMDVEAIVPGHGPMADKAAVREVRDYLRYVDEEARERHARGMTPLQAAKDIALHRWADWGEGERLVVNVANVYSEIDGTERGVVELFGAMAELDGFLRQEGTA